ncbi:MAG TPA: 1-(5-phosphoribosyl)-5-[(5-phosphoribosylamino)methylideneamino] imidazole-4-carboxamide isomerase [Longimicrobiales bacterium]|nr:1-(5-phosphoribosyl)-5-[(5-phosphoribosylamino)methylideneamino] imidazole-4-carboxamide isomerase [Longimicrobiales bacterium]
MIAFAAVDVRGGRVVQLVGGRPDAERISLPDPAAVARRWIECGFRALHIVDLDAALDHGDNRDAIDAVIDAAGAALVQVGGGVRTSERASQLLERGAARVVVGTRAVEDPAWLEQLARAAPGRVVVAADVDEGEVVLRGWTAGSGRTAEAFLNLLDPLPLAGVLVTDVTREGRMVGADRERFRRLAGATRHPLIASGGIAGRADLQALAAAGVAGVVLGMSLYTGAVDATRTAEEYGTWP